MDAKTLHDKLSSGRLTSSDVLAILEWQLSLPAEQMDCALISECDLFLAPDTPRLSKEREDALLASILARIDAMEAAKRRTKPNAKRARGAHRRPKRKAPLIALLMLALLALAVGGVAYGYHRGVLNFTEDFGFAKMVSQEGAEEFVSSGSLAHLALEHVTVDVIEAVCDGTELRVVYGLTSPDGEIHMAENSDYYLMPGSAEGEVHMCDYLRVNGQDAYFDDTWEALGDQPGQVLYYLQTNLTSWGVDITGAEELVIGLPMLPFDRENRVQPMVEFTISVDAPKELIRTAELVAADMAGLSASAEASVFSPLNGYVQLRIEGLTRERFNVDFTQLTEVRALDGTPLTDCHIADMEFYDGGALFGVTITPTEGEWPQEFVVAFLMEDDLPDWTATLKLSD